MAYDVKAVKKQWEGYETPLAWGRYPVEHEPIRRHCHMLDDTNPLFFEDGHCPPVMVDYFASLGPYPPADYDIFPVVAKIPTPGNRLINLNQEFETIAARGRVKKKGPEGRVDLELWIENAGEVTVPATATVLLPPRS